MKKLFAGIALLFTVFMFSGCILNYQDYNNPNATYISEVFYTKDNPYYGLASCERLNTLIINQNYFLVVRFNQPVHKAEWLHLYMNDVEDVDPYPIDYEPGSECIAIYPIQTFSGASERIDLGFVVECDDDYESRMKTIRVTVRSH